MGFTQVKGSKIMTKQSKKESGFNERPRFQIIPANDTNKKWYIRVTLPNSGGKKKSHTFEGTKRAAKAHAAKLIEMYTRGELTHETAKFDKAVAFWLKTVNNRIKPSTFDIYSSTLEDYFCPEFAGRKLQAIKTTEVQIVFNDLALRMQPSTLKLMRTILKQFFKFCMSQEWLITNPAQGVILPKSPRSKEKQILEPHRVTDFRQAAYKHPHGTLFLFLLTTGVRIGEALALTWDNLHFDDENQNHYVVINKSVMFRKKKRIVTSTKTGKSRKISIPEQMAQLLNGLNKQAKVVFSHKGKPMSYNMVSSLFRKFTLAQGLPFTNLHTLRHSTATLLLNEGVPIKLISEMLGHSSVVTTMDIYQHVIPDMQRQTSEKLSEIIFQTKLRQNEDEDEQF